MPPLKSCLNSPVQYICNTVLSLEYSNFQITQSFLQGLVNQRVQFIHSLIQQKIFEHLTLCQILC